MTVWQIELQSNTKEKNITVTLTQSAGSSGFITGVTTNGRALQSRSTVKSILTTSDLFLMAIIFIIKMVIPKITLRAIYRLYLVSNIYPMSLS